MSTIVYFLCPDKHKVEQEIKELQKVFELEDQGDMVDYIGINFCLNYC